jgi:hypothetical protein
MTIGRWHIEEDHGDVPFHVREALLLDPNEVEAGLLAFDGMIRGTFKEDVLRTIGHEAALPFGKAVIYMAFPLFWFQLDFVAARSGMEIQEQFRRLIVAVAAHFSGALPTQPYY